MKNFITILIICILIFCAGCAKKEKSRKRIIGQEKMSIVVNEKRDRAEMLKEKRIIKESTNQEEFFKGGIITKNGKYYGVYIVEEGDSVWIIAKKYAKYLIGNNYTKTNVGNISYWINRVNYSNFFGGVNDRLKIGEKVLVPISTIEKILEK